MSFDFNKLWILLSLQLMILTMPGVSLAVVVRNSALAGLMGGLLTAFGISFAIAFHVIFCILGTALISKSNFLFYTLKYGGGVYLVWLSYKFWQSSNKLNMQNKKIITISSRPNNLKKPYQFMKMGFFIDILNPYISLFHLSTFINVLPSSTSLTQKLLYASTIIAISFLWFCFIAFILSHHIIKIVLIRYNKWIEKIAAIILFFFSCQLLLYP